MSGFLLSPLAWQCSEGWAGRNQRESDSRLNSKRFILRALYIGVCNFLAQFSFSIIVFQLLFETRDQD